MKPTLDQASARVTCDRLPVIVTDGACLRQVLWNLINNAIKYRSHEPLTIHVGVSVEEGYWQFCVRDNGQGIPLEYAKQIFLMFKRLHGDEIPGSGIGLAICQRIIERFGGRIWVDSEPYRGSTFVFTIPFADAV
jgi:signal transduction histidine kinase